MVERNGTGKGWVRVMAEVMTDGLWDEDRVPMDADHLPVDGALKRRLAAWCASYEDYRDRGCDVMMYETWRDGQEGGEPSIDSIDRIVGFDVEAFSAEGLTIARAIKAELPGWTVVYFDKAAARGVESDAPRTTFEYLILEFDI